LFLCISFTRFVWRYTCNWKFETVLRLCYFHQHSALVVILTVSFLLDLDYILLSGILTCRPILKFLYYIFVVKNILSVFVFGIYIFTRIVFFLSRVWIILMCVLRFLSIVFLELDVWPQEGSSLFSKIIILKSALFWDIKRCRVVIVYRRFGTTYQSHLQESRVREDPWRWDRYVVPKRR
jgi:hypothetical protein